MINGHGALRRVLETACEEHGVNLRDLTVLSPQIDPYRFDTPTSHREGAWAAEQLQRLYGDTKRAHWRGLHYAIIMSPEKVRKPDGSIYQNSDDDWLWLQSSAGKAARWLGYIPFDRIIDQRNAPPIIHRKARVAPEPRLAVEFDITIPDLDDIEPTPVAVGFDVRQAFHFVIFGEKSSLEEILLPIAQRYHADLYLPTGEISDTQIYMMARDAAEDGRPLIVFTVSDCDPAGWQMPISIARKLQAFHDLLFPDLEFEVVPVALTPDQVRAENLPEEPLKPGELRAEKWRNAMGVAQTEVDALTTPSMQRRGVLRRFMDEAFAVYLDPTLDERVREAKEQWYLDAQEAISDQVDQEGLENIKAQAADRLEELRTEIDRINEQLSFASDSITLPPIEVPGPEIDLPDERQALVSLDHDFIEASQALIERKSYGKEDRAQ